jgi:hypothetical protein
MLRLLEKSVSGLVRIACWFALAGLLVMTASLIWPRALPVIFAMSVGQLIGIMAFGFYLLGVVVDARAAARAKREPGETQPLR